MSARKSYVDLRRRSKLKRVRASLQSFFPEVMDTSLRSPDTGSVSNDVEVEADLNVQLSSVEFETASSFNSRPNSSCLEDESIYSSEESDEDEDDQKKFSEELRGWSNNFGISHVSLTALLVILRTQKGFSFLPSDARTFFKTPRTISVKAVDPGFYYHIGIKKGLEIMMEKLGERISSLELLVGIDGVPLFKSIAGELWPILVSVFNVPSLKSIVFPVGVYYGRGKPDDCRNFMEDFIQELNVLICEGFIYKGVSIPVSLKGFICDAPAKSFILRVKGHTGYSSCTKCTQEGDFYENRMTFPNIHSRRRTHESFLDKEDLEYHRGDCPLVEIRGIHFISSFPLDYMHLVCLGVMRTMILIWMFARVPLKLPHHIISSISTSLIALRSSVPNEFSRKPRALNEIRRWKATEFRQFLLYTGPLVLHALRHEYEVFYDNFLCLHVAISILLSPQFCDVNREYARQLLELFVDTFKNLYGQKYMTYNLHGLLHLSDDVEIFGPLDNYSAFRFENFLHSLKKLVRKGEKPLQQIGKRLAEMSYCNAGKFESLSNCKRFPNFLSPHHSGPLLEDCSDPQYKAVKFHSFKISNSPPNSCCLLKDGSIAVVFNIAFSKSRDCMAIICKKILISKDIYGSPLCKSSSLGIQEVNTFSEFQVKPVSDIFKKMVLLPSRSNFVAFPLIHCE